MSINKAFIAGNLTREPELRQTSSGMSVLGFGIAVNDRRKDASGQWGDYPNYFDVTMFGNRAETLAPMLSKGMKVTIEGKLRWSQWEDRSGQKRSKVEIIAEEVELPPRSRQEPQQELYADTDLPF